MHKPFLAVFFAGIDFQSFGGLNSSNSAVCSQSATLVDAAVVVRFIEFHISQAFPFSPMLIIVARIVR